MPSIWDNPKQAQNRYQNKILKIIDNIINAVNNQDTADEIISKLNAIANHSQFQSLADNMANTFATMVGRVEAVNWKEAAKEATKSRVIFEGLKDVINNKEVGKVTKDIVINNANLIKTLPLDIAQQITKAIATSTWQGKRSSVTAKEIKPMIEKYGKAKAHLIARTETSKAQQALTQARSLDLGVHWYIWKTAHDGNRVRPGHRHMYNVIVNYDDPPAPEELIGEKSQGHYHAGNIYNCRCYCRPLIDMRNIDWPAKVYYHGQIKSLTKNEFEALNAKLYPPKPIAPPPAPVQQQPIKPSGLTYEAIESKIPKNNMGNKEYTAIESIFKVYKQAGKTPEETLEAMLKYINSIANTSSGSTFGMKFYKKELNSLKASQPPAPIPAQPDESALFDELSNLVTPMGYVQFVDISKNKGKSVLSVVDDIIQDMQQEMDELTNDGDFDAASKINTNYTKLENFKNKYGLSVTIKSNPLPQAPKPVPVQPIKKQYKFVSSGSHLGGAGQKSIYEDEQGQKYLYKPATNKNGTNAEFKAHVQEAAYKIQNIVDPDTAVPVEVRTLEGKLGTVQKFVEANTAKDPDFLYDWQHGYSDHIDNTTLKQLQKEHVTDWLIGNFDAHGKNFVVSKDNGKLVGIDKEQAFKYLNDPKSEHMDYNYHPNSQYGETEPIYNTMFKKFANGDIDLDLGEILPYIEKVQAISDDEYKAMFEKYVKELYQDKYMQNVMMDKILAKKQNLKTEYEAFFSKLLSEQQGKQISFTFAKGVNIQPKQQQTTSQAPIVNSFDYSKYIDVSKDRTKRRHYVEKHEAYGTGKTGEVSKAEHQAIYEYSGSSYIPMNNAMRRLNGYNLENASQTIKNHIENAKRALSNAPALEDDVVMYRMVDSDAIGGLFNKDVQRLADDFLHNGNTVAFDNLNKKVSGGEFADPGFVSTTHEQGSFGSSKDIMFEFYLPKGFNQALFIEGFSRYGTAENEVLLNSDIEMAVLGVEQVVRKNSYEGERRKILFKVTPKSNLNNSLQTSTGSGIIKSGSSTVPKKSKEEIELEALNNSGVIKYTKLTETGLKALKNIYNKDSIIEILEDYMSHDSNVMSMLAKAKEDIKKQYQPQKKQKVTAKQLSNSSTYIGPKSITMNDYPYILYIDIYSDYVEENNIKHKLYDSKKGKYFKMNGQTIYI